MSEPVFTLRRTRRCGSGSGWGSCGRTRCRYTVTDGQSPCSVTSEWKTTSWTSTVPSPSRAAATRRNSAGTSSWPGPAGFACVKCSMVQVSGSELMPGTVPHRSGGGPGRSGPELALQCGGRLLQRARVGAGGEVLPAAVADDEADVGPPAGGQFLVGDAQRGVQDRAGRDAGEDALALHQLAGAVDGVLGSDGEPRVQQRRVVQ